MRWTFLLLGTCIAIAVVMQGPQLRHTMQPESRGLLVRLNSDEEIYLARVQEALSGRGSQSGEAFVGDPTLRGTQPAFLERIVGTAFSWTGLRAAEVLQILDSVEPVLLFLLLIVFFRVTGFSMGEAYAGALLFVLIDLYALNRPIHPRLSFLFLLSSLTCTGAALRYHWSWALPAGALFGLLVGVYFWSFTFGWLYLGILLFWALLRWIFREWREHQRISSSRWRRFSKTVRSFLSRLRGAKHAPEDWHLLIGIALIGLLFAVPFLSSIWSASRDPLYNLAVFRSGMHPSRLPESWPYSILFLIMGVSLLISMVRREWMSDEHQDAATLVFAAFLFINQQVIHGVTFYFTSHAIFPLVTAAICVVLLAHRYRTYTLFIGALAAAVYIGAIAYDGRYVLHQWRVRAEDFQEQHLVDAFPILDAIPRGTVLSDPETSAFIAGATHHDIVYSIYLKNILMSNEEIAERFCLTQLPLLPSQRAIESRWHLVHPDADEVFGDPKIREREVALVLERCASLDANPASALSRYGVEFVFWDRKRMGDWNLARLLVDLTEITHGEGWALFAVH